MSDPIRRTVAAAAMGGLLVTGLSGCGKTEVKKSDLESQIKSKLDQSNTGGKLKIGAVTCDDALEAKVEAKTECKVPVDGTTQKVSVTVTKVDGKTVNYTVRKDNW